jgi:ankyrin repeat protein
MMMAVDKGHAGIVDTLIQAVSEQECNKPGILYDYVNRGETDGDTPLKWATVQNYDVIMRSLIRAGAVVDAGNVNGDTPLMAACRHGHIAVVNVLLECGGSASAVDSHGKTVLMHACVSMKAEVVKTVFNAIKRDDRREMANMRNNDGETAIMMCIKSCTTESRKGDRQRMLEMLINEGGDPFACDNNGLTALHHAAKVWRSKFDKQRDPVGLLINVMF